MSQSEQKQIFLKPYEQVSDLEKALKTVRQIEFDKMAVSVIGNVGEDHINKSKELTTIEYQLRRFFSELLAPNTAFDTFYNPELGRLFVAGFLVETFQNSVGKRGIGELYGGPYGILRGLGITETDTIASINKLKGKTYLLVARGNRLDIQKLKNQLGNQLEDKLGN
ncbi:hypothetical protein ZONE111905_13895 [Zobellia nedashkovskayae]